MMTERQWATATTDLDSLLAYVIQARQIRKLRLFLCACFRDREQPKWADEGYEVDRAAVELVESWADGLVPQGDVFTAGVTRRTNLWLFPNDAEMIANGVFVRHYGPDPGRAEQPRWANFLRDIFGNPFRPLAFDPAWRTSDVIALANGIYEQRAFDQLPILADALQDAGCDAADLLHHLRDPGATHVRGCWALDLVLGKE